MGGEDRAASADMVPCWDGFVSSDTRPSTFFSNRWTRLQKSVSRLNKSLNNAYLRITARPLPLANNILVNAFFPQSVASLAGTRRMWGTFRLANRAVHAGTSFDPVGRRSVHRRQGGDDNNPIAGSFIRFYHPIDSVRLFFLERSEMRGHCLVGKRQNRWNGSSVGAVSEFQPFELNQLW